MRQGDIVIARLDPATAAELGKLRPVVILTSDLFLAAQPSVLFVCPLMSRHDPRYGDYLIRIPQRERLQKDSYAAIHQCRSISRQRILANEVAFARCTPLELANILDHLLLLTDAHALLDATRPVNAGIMPGTH